MFFKKKFNLEVVPECDYTDFSEREAKSPYASKKTVIAALTPLAVAVPVVAYHLGTKEGYTTTTIPVASAIIEPSMSQSVAEPIYNVVPQATGMIPVINPTPPHDPGGVIADTSLNMLANVLDPLIDLMVAVAFPIASVIIIGGCFFFMIGNSEKAWDTIGKAALGYIVIRLSPMLLDILRTAGDAVA